ncbi:OLC1v1003645C1 [Oldenlandia corymbosa var. corymbosa]|uniref:tRNA:m(4)X modification enzyme TRM13 n=1 Tax=Oldenlandia corymbosa var. corymbosa TaxID=529605 RepID=A0AAV1DDV7_OLDCO|nr:OLC1v1003645C1 [Oldenlandia corymbosa var. corymbosa]
MMAGTNEGGHCRFWLPKKNRFCSQPPLRDSSYCGNHTSRSNQQWIPCPIDPSHSVLGDNLRNHIARCPLQKQALSLSLQPYYQKGINAGTEGEEEEEGPVTSEQKRRAIHSKTAEQFFDLIRKIKTLHASVVAHEDIVRHSFQIPDACAIWADRQVDQKLPFQEKHARQQASILGNMEQFGILEKPGLTDVEHSEVPAVVDFGAGRGYLTQMLADCYGIKKVILVERKAYKLKADRSLRQIESLELERLRIDIEDLNLNAVESLQGLSYLAIGKHLCGPATDMMLKCCIWPRGVRDGEKCFLRGLAVATCCHHLCQWKHYINKSFMSNLGVTKDDFHAMTWFTSWAVDSDHEYDLSEIDESQHLNLMEEDTSGPDAKQSEVEGAIKKMSPADRAVLGLMCKDIIDVGRLMWLKEQSLLHSRMVNYVPPSISPENHLLIASGR